MSAESRIQNLICENKSGAHTIKHCLREIACAAIYQGKEKPWLCYQPQQNFDSQIQICYNESVLLKGVNTDSLCLEIKN